MSGPLGTGIPPSPSASPSAPPSASASTPASTHRVFRPDTLDDALALLAAHRAVPLAGGTDLLVQHAERPPVRPWLDLSRVGALQGLSTHSARVPALRIGALTAWRELADHPLPPGLTALAQAARSIANPSVRARGTLGGNLCAATTVADGPPALLAFDAQVELASVHGLRHLPVAAFLQGAGRTARRADELLTAVLLPFRSPRARSRYLKLGLRQQPGAALVAVAVACDFDASARVTHCGIAVAGCNPVARRLPALEGRLRTLPRTALADAVDRQLGPRAAVADRATALAALQPVDDGRATAAWRRDAVAVMIRRAVAEIAAVPSDAVED